MICSQSTLSRWPHLVIVCLHLALSTASLPGVEVRNSSFQEARGTTLSAEEVAAMRQRGWKCPDAKDWPHSWGGQGSQVTVEFPRMGGRRNDAFCRLSASNSGYVNGYWGKPFKPSQILTFWAKGKGALRAGLMAYKLSDDHKRILPGGRMPPLEVEINSEEWVRYRYLMKKPNYELTGHPLFQTLKGTIDFDDVDILDSDPALDVIVAEENRLYGKNALVESLKRVASDATFVDRLQQYRAATREFESAGERVSAHLLEPMRRYIAALKPYVESKGLRTVQATHYNQMLVLTRVLNRLAGKSVGSAMPLETTRLKDNGEPYFPGKRDPRPSQLTITDVRSNKLRYNEYEPANTIATLVNQTAGTVTGVVRAKMIVDLGAVRPLAEEQSFTIKSGETRKWRFTYNVGPETYGRAIEVEFVDDQGKRLDRWQEYYAVAREFFRVHQHSYQVKAKYWAEDPHIFYFNQTHYFAHEPTGLGAEPFDAEIYITGQTGYRINQKFRKAQMAFNKAQGILSTFYVIGAFDGQMGYEQARQHPEFLLYDPNGQPAVDTLYGGYPNPMELASPLEVGPKRKTMKIKSYLDREIQPWQHVNMNMARVDAVLYAINRIKAYAKSWGFGGVYWDGCLGVWAGFDFEGKRNVPSGKYEDYVDLNARNHRLWNKILKADDPYFGTWMNWGLEGATGDFAKRHGITIWRGTGVEDDPRDDNIRAATDAKNVMLLDEHQSFSGDDYRKLLRDRLRSRDHYVQKYGASHIIGYANSAVDLQEPGATKWGWPAWNHVMSLLIATQSHLASSFVPSHRPGMQFMTRYSRFIWARDIRAVAPQVVEQDLQLQAGEELWWKRLVYQRKTATGRDVIIHLVRVPPTPKVDYAWADEPALLTGVEITMNAPGERLSTAQACRAYHYEESQQVVQQEMRAKASGPKVTIAVPPFRYHAMLVLRFTKAVNKQR
ncbi:MAG: hypothetical protein CMJ75_20425 [Planctomycetaceae bacterium]|nr:hypothetical protein [Planctomycetaceae bacterium]